MERQPSLESKTAGVGKKRRVDPASARAPETVGAGKKRRVGPASVTAAVRTAKGRPPCSGELAIVPTPSTSAASPTEHSGYENEEDQYDMNDEMSESQPSHVSVDSGSGNKNQNGSVDGNKNQNDTTFVLLDWWKVNTHRFPVISRMARRFLTIPATSVSSESTFSTGGRVLDDYRSSLLPSMVEKLVCASSWIRGSCNDNKSPKVVVKDEDGDVELVPFPECVVESS